ncbi:MAG: YcbK family protein [Nitratireductor sp.]|nr:YcbK family protein [Nitratireductor sp.]
MSRHAADLCCRSTVTKPRAGRVIVTTMAFLMLGGCVSSVAPLGSDTQSLQSSMEPIALDVAETDASSAALANSVSDVASVETNGSLAAPAQVALASGQPGIPTTTPASDAAEMEVALASIVPTPAPRTNDITGIAMAFAPTGDPEAIAGNTIAAASTSNPAAETPQTGVQTPAPAPSMAPAMAPSMAPAPVATAVVSAPPAKPKSLFEALFAKRQAAPQQPKTQVASLSPSTPVTASATAGSATALPGVKDNNSLFGTTDDEEGEDSGGVQLASAGAMSRMSPLGIVTQTDHVQVGCFKPELIALLGTVERHYGRKPIVTSGYRNPSENRRAGGARKSMHMLCKAADIQVEGVSKWDLAKYLRTIDGRGGVGTYCRTNSVHIDTGDVRDWHYPCRRNKKKRV